MNSLLKLVLALVYLSITTVSSTFAQCECTCDEHNSKWKGISIDEIPIYFKTFSISKHDEEFDGHTLDKHIGKSQDWLDGRLAGSRHEKFVSTYSDAATASDIVREIVLENQDKIKAWMEDQDKDKLVLSKTFDSKIGVAMKKKDKEIKDCNVGVVVLKRPHKMSEKFYIITSYPVVNIGDLESEHKEWKTKNNDRYNDKYSIKH